MSSFVWALIGFVVAAGLVAAFLPSNETRAGGWGTFGIILLYFLATGITGIAVGFLFAVPRLVTVTGVKPETQASTEGEEETSTQRAQQSLLGSNSNLERISDWLTSAIVALSLANVGKVSDWLSNFGATAQNSLCVSGAPICGGVMSVTVQTVIVFAGMAGLLLGYMHTRVFISVLFRDAEQEIRQAARSEALFGDQSLELSVLEAIATTQPGTTPDISAIDRVKLQTMANRDLSKETDAKRALLVAEARLLLSKPIDAAAAAERAMLLAADDAMIQRRATDVKARASALRSSGGPGLDAQMVAIYRALFEPAPGGFTRAITIGESLQRTGAPLPPQFWVNLASAYGQQHEWLTRSSPPDEAATAKARSNVRTSVETALALGPQWRLRLRELYEPSCNPSSDKDLVSLYPDPELDRMLVGPPS